MTGACELHPCPHAGSAPIGIAAAGDDVWFAMIGSGKIGRYSPSGGFKEYRLWDDGAKPHAIVAAPEGGFWFTAWAANCVGYISREGRIEHFPIPTPQAEPHGITIGPDGCAWVALEAGKLARVSKRDTLG
jgi:virginiamycin B lyase